MQKEIVLIIYYSIQILLIVFLLYFSGRVILVMYSLSPLNKGRVPYVSTKLKFIAKGFEFLSIRKGEKVVDLGSGDGKFLLYGARRVDADFTGVELNRFLYWLSRVKSSLTKKIGSVHLKRKNYYDENLRQYDKIFLFNMPSELKRLRSKLEEEVQPGVKVLSVMFPIESDKFRLLDKFSKKSYVVYLYERTD